MAGEMLYLRFQAINQARQGRQESASKTATSNIRAIVANINQKEKS